MKKYLFKIIVLGMMLVVASFGFAKTGVKTKNRGVVRTQEITIEQAKQIAARKAGVDVSRVFKIKVDMEYGRKVYEGTIKHNGMEYDFDIDALTGKIIKWDVEVDD